VNNSPTLADLHAATEAGLLRLGREIENDPTCRPGSGCGDGMSRVDAVSGKRRALTNVEMSAVLRWASHKECEDAKRTAGNGT
jgi:hypothetical protein